ncbi:MAG: hypothetical protein JWO38_5203 [Gemmataceae bacterium]|nr:hypothetical protein [Gemmataceae bacterium]
MEINTPPTRQFRRVRCFTKKVMHGRTEYVNTPDKNPGDELARPRRRFERNASRGPDRGTIVVAVMKPSVAGGPRHSGVNLVRFHPIGWCPFPTGMSGGVVGLLPYTVATRSGDPTGCGRAKSSP